MRVPQICAGILVLAISGCTGAPRQRPVKMGPVDEGKGSLTAARQYLEGRWSLESFELYRAGKPVTLNGSGTLTFDEFANLTMEIRADQSATNVLQDAGIVLNNGTISTTGRTVVDMQKRTLAYAFEGRPPIPTGPFATSRLRYWQVDGNVLTLSTRDDGGAPMSVSKWRKMP
jgi:hypothetical protein